MDDPGAVDEVELGQGRDPFTVQRRLEAEVDALQRLDRHKPGGAQGDIGPPPLACCIFLARQPVDGVGRGDLPFTRCCTA